MDVDGPSSLSSSIPDIMNDAKFTPQPKWKGKGSEEVDTCRICRGEGTQQEPLFHPCRCSGSIKFVHQECLMEWLSHSQKKHCELCKTSFRFTKLYHPEMPQSLPTSIFLRRATIQTLKTLLTWCRVALVVCIWLLWLPWSMRFVWWGLFWIADGGWACQVNKSKHEQADFLRLAQRMSSASDESSSTTSSSTTASTSTAYNFTASLMKDLLSVLPGFSHNETQSSNNQASSAANVSLESSQALRHGSLLANTQFFQTLTPIQPLNKFITDVLEGQIITLLVVVVVVLIFLIREWVVQQQPAANLNIGPLPEAVRNANGAMNVPGRADRDGNVVNGQGQDEIDESSAAREDRLNENRPDALVEHLDHHQNDQSSNTIDLNLDTQQTAMGRDDNQVPGTEPSTPALPESSHRPTDFNYTLDDSSANFGTSSSNSQERNILNEQAPLHARPTMPVRAHSSLATEIQRGLEERNSRRDIQRERSFHDTEGDARSDSDSGGWQHLSGSDHSNSAGDEFQASQAESPRPQLRRKPKTERLSSDFQGSIHPHSVQGTSETGTTRPNISANPADLEGLSPPAQIEFQGSTHSGPATDSKRGATERSLFDRTNYEEESDLQDLLDEQSSEQPNTNLDEQAEEQPENMEDTEEHQSPVRSLTDKVLDWLWGDLVPADPAQAIHENEERVVQDLANEAPFVPFIDAQPDNRAQNIDAENDAQDPEVAAEAARAGINPNDADGVEDAEDLEGIMELLGMQGPLMGLVQNALFCAVLVSATVTTAVWFPYIWGKLVLIPLSDPAKWLIRIPLNFLSGTINICIDFFVFLAFSILHWFGALFSMALIPIRNVFPSLRIHKIAGSMFGDIADSALLRITNIFLSAGNTSECDYVLFSISSHAALRSIQWDFTETSKATWDIIRAGYAEAASSFTSNSSLEALLRLSYVFMRFAFEKVNMIVISLVAWTTTLFKSNFTTTASASATNRSPSLDLDLAHWTTTDRLVTILIGYSLFSILGALYLNRSSNFSTSEQGRRIENAITEILNQAGGILKVILIISIEMIAFPLYCGALLDLALLPLFPPETASIQSRIEFTQSSPWTSAFLHWFIGTCYMFHFALFVSMCRKIMRNGVLYFIRDPDDPTFHPVRDVLERNVSSQLRKIGFSAVVYGALVIICLGSVVWTVAHFSPGIFPVRWTSSPSVLEFPIDLLLYNFLAPFLVHLFKPSKGLHAAYEWWFRKCARALRLSHFLFGEERSDEQGDSSNPSVTGQPKSGKFVRAPATDQVRIPKGYTVFLEVDNDNQRVDGADDYEQGIHGKSNENFVKVYIPPWFRVRISLFVMALWALTAAVGVAITVVPLLFGRWLFSFVVSDSISDIYAFCVGFCTLGGLAYAISSHREALKKVKDYIRIDAETIAATSQFLESLFQRSVRVLYTYSAFALLIPAVLALLLEFYFVMPMQAYLASSPQFTAAETNFGNDDPSLGTLHTIFFLQDWALGVLYLRIAIRLALWSAESRPARALRAIVAQGWTNPNAYLATRCFIAPILAVAAIALLFPGLLGYAVSRVICDRLDETGLIQVRRLAYPAVLAVALVMWLVFVVMRAFHNWRRVIRDEVYLIGERLHNFGEQKPPPKTAASLISNRLEGRGRVT